MSMSTNDIKWFENLSNFLDFYKKEGRVMSLKEDKKLHNWYKNARMHYYNHFDKKIMFSMSDDRIKALEESEFPLEKSRSPKTFEERLEELKKYKQKFGTTHISQTQTEYGSEYHSLSRWINGVRTQLEKEELSVERFNQLEKIGFIWNVEDLRFEEKVKKLKSFYKKHGHFDVPQKGKTKKFGNWVATLRCRKPKSKKYVKWLNDIGFVWSGKKERRKEALKTLYPEFYI